MGYREKAKHISNCLELAILLEISAAKPGNVNFSIGFKGTRVEHFLASAVAAASSFEEAAEHGIAVQAKRLSICDVEIGQIIKNCVVDISAWQKGGNTLLGTVILFVPIAVAAGMTPIEDDFDFNFHRIRQNLRLTTESTTPMDAVNLYEAVDIAKPSGLGKAPEFDVKDSASKTRIISENVSLFEVFRIAESYDAICSEWVNNYPITFDVAFPFLIEQLKHVDLNTAIVHTFLKILSEYPDTFIARKVGADKAREISFEAEKVLKLGGIGTLKGRASAIELDRKLRKSGNLLNPGTTADITAAALALCTLSGYRP